MLISLRMLPQMYKALLKLCLLVIHHPFYVSFIQVTLVLHGITATAIILSTASIK